MNSETPPNGGMKITAEVEEHDGVFSVKVFGTLRETTIELMTVSPMESREKAESLAEHIRDNPAELETP